MSEKKFFGILAVLSLVSAVLLGSFFLFGFVLKDERLDEEMKAFFGSSTEFAEELEDKYIYCAYSRREPPESVKFWVKKENLQENNFIEQMMKRDAMAFWGEKGREACFATREGDVYTLEEGVEAYQLEDPLYLSVSCSSWEDLAACAEEMGEWIEYAFDDMRYFWNHDYAGITDSVFSRLEIRMKGEAFWIDFSNDWSPYPNSLGTRLEKTLIDLMKEEYDRLFPDEPRPKEQGEELLTENEIQQRAQEETEAQQETLTEEEAWQVNMEKWVRTYDGAFEPDVAVEAVLEEENICYRLLNVDYIMGDFFYVLLKSSDGKKTWELVNAEPFGGSMYGAAEMTFWDANNGSIAGIYTDHSSNQYRKKIYVTEDGGKTFVESKWAQPR